MLLVTESWPRGNRNSDETLRINRCCFWSISISSFLRAWMIRFQHQNKELSSGARQRGWTGTLCLTCKRDWVLQVYRQSENSKNTTNLYLKYPEWHSFQHGDGPEPKSEAWRWMLDLAPCSSRGRQPMCGSWFRGHRVDQWKGFGGFRIGRCRRCSYRNVLKMVFLQVISFYLGSFPCETFKIPLRAGRWLSFSVCHHCSIFFVSHVRLLPSASASKATTINYLATPTLIVYIWKHHY